MEADRKSAKTRTRNICILAHVDHGKTTLADHLIAGAGGGVLHPKQAGKLRYLDYRDDEQQRAITMKSASIALRFQGHLVNLIDSPGHIDFCSEVSTAVRLSDGALVLVDVCEGVHIQTRAVLRQAWMEQVKPCLVLNKMDRLITELKLTPLEAYTRMQGIIVEVNNIMSGFRSEKYLSDVDSTLAGAEDKAGVSEQEEVEFFEDYDDSDSEKDFFSPQQGNVAFSSAIDGWAFRTHQFAEFHVAKMNYSLKALRKCLWGDFYHRKNLDGKDVIFVGKKAGAGKRKPMFVQCILEPLWQVYSACMEGNHEMVKKVVEKMKLNVSDRELRNRDPRQVLHSVMTKWLPLHAGILSMVIEELPDPGAAQPYRSSTVFPRRLIAANTSRNVQDELQAVRKAVESCDDRSETPCVTFVSKMFAVPVEMLPRHGPNGESVLYTDITGDLDSSGRECFLAFARVFSGVISVGQQLFVISTLYDPTDAQQDKKNLQVARVEALYNMMGRGLEPCERATAGNVVAIRGLGQHILKSATLSSTQNCWPFANLSFQAAPIVRVAVEPSDPANMAALSRGLKLLNKADPFVEVSLSSTGEHVISAAGEVHLELCIKDLKERFARVELEVSPPLVAFRETIDESAVEAKTAQQDFLEATTPNGRCTVRVHVSRLPNSLTQLLDENAELLKNLVSGKKKLEAAIEGKLDPVEALRSRLITASKSEKKGSTEIDWHRVWALGPRGVGPNILLVPDYDRPGRFKGGTPDDGARATAEVRGSPNLSELLGFPVAARKVDVAPDSLACEADGLEGSIVAGFQLATGAGPLCEEPLWGLAFTIEASISETSNATTAENSENQAATSTSYGVITTVKDACRAAVMSKLPRLVEAMYLCEVSTNSQYLGQMYGVLAKRRARVLREEMREGMDMFTVHAFMPVAESFGFADELRRKTSGAASPQLMLSHWEALCEDPFFVPKTDEEREEFGDGSSVPQNTARKLVDAVRRRKGLHVEEKVVRHATKQRTLARKV